MISSLGKLSYTGLKCRKTKEPLLLRLGIFLIGVVILVLFFRFMNINNIISDPVYQRLASSLDGQNALCFKIKFLGCVYVKVNSPLLVHLFLDPDRRVF